MEKSGQNEKKKNLQRLIVILGPDQERGDIAAVKGGDHVQRAKKKDLGVEIGGQGAETSAQGAGTDIQGAKTSAPGVGTDA